MTETALDLVLTRPTLRLKRGGDVMHLVLERPPANEIGSITVEDFYVVLDALAGSDAKVLLVESALPHAFSAGADLRELEKGLSEHLSSGRPRAEALARVRTFLDRIHGFMNALDLLPMTTIAVLSGVVFGGGFELALACDLRIADQSARFAFPELRLGLVPGWGGTVRLRREAPAGLVRDLLLTGRTLGADRAHQLGLVSQVVPRGEARAAAMRTAQQCARFERQAVASAKRLTKALPEAELEAEKVQFLSLLAHDDGHDGGPVARALRAFVTSKDIRPYLPNVAAKEPKP